MTTTEIVPDTIRRRIHDGEMLMVGMALGVGVIHHVYLMNAETTRDHFIVLDVPESGPPAWILKFRLSAQPVFVLEVGNYASYPSALAAALLYAANRAVAAVEAEMQ